MKNSRRDLQQLRTGRLPMIDDAAPELVALSEFSRSDHDHKEEDGDEKEGDDGWNEGSICFLRSHLGHWWVTSVRVVPSVLPSVPTIPILRSPIKTCQKISLLSSRYSPIFFKPATGARMSFPDVHCCKRMLQVTIGSRTLKKEDMKPR